MRIFISLLLVGILLIGVNQAGYVNKQKLHDQLQHLENSVINISFTLVKL